MRGLIVGMLGLMCCSVALAGGRLPVRVTLRPVYVVTSHCVTIRGVDYDLEPILTEYRTEWTWPGGTLQTLREHLRDEHQVTGLDGLSDREIRKLHAVLHERAKKVARASSGPPVVRIGPVSSSRCPGGVCPVPSGSRGWLFPRRVMWAR